MNTQPTNPFTHPDDGAASETKPEPAAPVQNNQNPPAHVGAVTVPFVRFTVSGCYYNSRKETVDFDNLIVEMPYCGNEGVAEMHLRGRYVARAIKDAVDEDGKPRYKERVEKMRQAHVDNTEFIKGQVTFVGKDIKTLNHDELQDLASFKDLRFIPLPNSGFSRRDSLVRAYVDYSQRVLRRKVEWQKEEFNFTKQDPIILDSAPRVQLEGKISNDEMIEQEMNASKPVDYGSQESVKNRFSMEDLKALADSRGIGYPEDVEFDDLYAHLFSG